MRADLKDWFYSVMLVLALCGAFYTVSGDWLTYAMLTNPPPPSPQPTAEFIQDTGVGAGVFVPVDLLSPQGWIDFHRNI